MTMNPARKYRIGKTQLDLLEELSNANGVSGDEGEVREIIRKRVRGLADEVKVDAMGNLLVRKRARKAPGFRVMMDAHMDEVGFMLVEQESDGSFIFEKVGGGDERQFISKAVVVGKEKIPGVIGCKPIHLTDVAERETIIAKTSLRIDLGPAGKDKAARGDYAAYATRFHHAGDAIFAKALDDRLGCATLIEILKSVPEHIDFLASFTVQEEIGLRGAKIAAYDFDPQVIIAVDSTPAHDLPRPDGRENTQYNCKLRQGPAIYLSDAGTLSDPRLIRFLKEVAEKNKIPYQFRQPGGGGTNAGALHLTRQGVPAVSVSIPGRYAHTAVMLASISDWQNTLRLLKLALEQLTPNVLKEDRF